MILVDAHPKCGTNLIKKVLGGFGFKHELGGLIRHQPGQPMAITKGGKWASFDTPHTHFMHAHICAGSLPNPCQMVFCLRDPRNALLSFLRWAEKRDAEVTPFKVCEEDALRLIYCGPYGAALPWAQSWNAFAMWYGAKGVCSVRFEELCHDGGVSVARIAGYVNVDPDKVAGVYEGLFGNGKDIAGRPVYEGASTWTGQWSDWRDLWTDRIDAAWTETGGPEFEKRFGYEKQEST